jgi:hypothetical protein
LSGDASSDKSSLFGVVSFRPRITVVLIFLTLTVAVVGYNITRQKGAQERDITREALRIFAGNREWLNAVPRDPAWIEERIREWTGMKVTLPRDERLFSYKGAAMEKVGKRKAAAVQLTFSEEPYLLMVLRSDTLRGTGAPPALFPGSSFLSWEKEGLSFVSWERDGALFFLVSGVDLTQTFDLVRQHFT